MPKNQNKLNFLLYKKTNVGLYNIDQAIKKNKRKKKQIIARNFLRNYNANSTDLYRSQKRILFGRPTHLKISKVTISKKIINKFLVKKKYIKQEKKSKFKRYRILTLPAFTKQLSRYKNVENDVLLMENLHRASQNKNLEKISLCLSL